MLVAPTGEHITSVRHRTHAQGAARRAMDPFCLGVQDAEVDDDYLMSIGMLLPSPPPQPAAATAASAMAQGSAFAAYQQRAATTTLLESSPMSRQGNSGGEGGNDAHRRMLSYLRRIGSDAAAVAHTAPAGQPSGEPRHQAPRSSRFRHLMRERLRRERLSQGYADLHALLPAGASNGAKNDTVAAAIGYIRELEGAMEWLRARNEELLERTAAARSGGGSCAMVVKVRAESERHSVAVDVFEMVLRRLKAMEELRVTAIRSCFCAGGMWMDVGVECKISSCEVDKAITNALMELQENTIVQQDPGGSKLSFSCQVQRGVLNC
ncbi:hypothetical protein ACP70R_038427 [Stipagrostis hirtigluma subsp. patula]